MKFIIKFYLLVLIWLSCFTCSIAQIDTFQGLVEWFPMNGNALNAVNTKNDCQVIGATLTEDRFGRADYAYHFNGNTYLLANYNSIGFNGITYTAWIRTSLMNRLQTIVLFQGAYACYISHFSPGHFMTAYDADSWNNSTNDESVSVVVNGTWTFVAASNDGFTTRIYVNGVLEKSYPEVLVTRNDKLEIGRKLDDDGSGFVGDIDDLRIYGRKLADSEVMKTFEDTSAPVVKAPVPFSFKIYPNPTADKIKIALDTLVPDVHLALFDAIGREILKSVVNSKETILNLSDYRSGMYFMRLSDGHTSIVRKIVLTSYN